MPGERQVEGRDSCRDLLEAVHDMIWSVDTQGAITFVNPAVRRILGYAPEELIGRSHLDLLTPEERARQPFQHLLAGSQEPGGGIEFEVLDRDSHRHKLLARMVLQYDPQGLPIGAVGVCSEITERGTAEDVLSLQVAALNAAANAIVITDRAGSIAWANQAFSDLTGYSKIEALGRNPRELLKSGCHEPDFYNALWDTILSGQVWRGEMVNRRKDGSLYTEEMAITPVRDADGEIRHFVAVKQDITDRKSAEETIREHGRLAAAAVTVGLSLNAVDSLPQALQQCAEALAVQLDAAFVRIWTLHESDAVLELQASAGLHTHLNGPHARVPLGHFECGRIAKDRAPYMTNAVIGDPCLHDQDWARREGLVAFAGHPLIANDQLVGVVALFARHALSRAALEALAAVADHIALGIAHRRNAQALRTAEERMRFALMSANIGIWDMDYRTKLLMWSETQEVHYGLEPGTFNGTLEAFIDRILPEDRASALEAIGKAVQGGGDFSVQYRVPWPDGKVRWLHDVGRILLDESGQPLRGVGISMDVTEQRNLESQFRHAQKLEAVGRLAAGVAHDFNNLLTAIIGYTQLMKRRLPADHPATRDAEEVLAAGERAAALTRQLLAFSRQQVLKPRVLDLNSVVTGIDRMLHRLIGDDIDLQVTCGPDLGHINADPGQVEQVIMNLVVNARDAMPDGGRLDLEIGNVELAENDVLDQPLARPGRYVFLSVTDTGCGMSAEILASVFEPFFTTKGVGQGTGLGLSTVHGIVQQSGGHIEAHSEVGVGTTFKVYLPRVDSALDEATNRDPNVLAGGTETVLIVEDEARVREVVAETLRMSGYKVLEASEPGEAMSRAREHKGSLELLLTDVMLPRMNGPELAEEITSLHPEARVLFMSGYTDTAVVRQKITEGGAAFLQKPFKDEALLLAIRDLLDDRLRQAS